MPHKHNSEHFYMANPELDDALSSWLEEFGDLTTYCGVNYGLAFYLPFCREIDAYRRLVECEN